MASIRRTLSPYDDRHYQNGVNLFSVQTQSHKVVSSNGGKHSSLFSTFRAGVHRFLWAERSSRKAYYYSWKRSMSRCFFFFFVGFLLGLVMIGAFEDIKNRHFLFDRDASESRNNLVVGLPENAVGDKVKVSVKESLSTRARFGGGLTDEKSLKARERFDNIPQKQLIVVTPTYERALQAFYLNRLGQVLRLVPPPLIWIVVEMNAVSMETATVLREVGVMHRHLVCSKNLTNIKDRGVHQRNTALDHIERHKLDGIVYLADDDNIYSLELFESIRRISRFGTWPVAMLAQSKSKTVLEGPVCNGSQVVGWHTNEKSKRLRRFHIDMSGFAFNSTILWDPKRWQRPSSDPIRQLDTVKEGFQETTFIEQLVEDESQMEGTPTGCSRIMNWHLHLEARELHYPKGWLLNTNLDTVLRINE